MTDEPIPNADIDELIVAQWGDHQRPIKADLREFARRVLALPATRPSKDAAASHSQAPAEPLSYDRIAEAWHKLTGGFDHPTDDFEAGFRTAVRAQAPAASPPPTEPIATVIKRHSFVTGQDRYLIEPHAGVDLSEFAHQQLFPRDTLTSTVSAASPASDARNLELTEGWDIEPPLRHVKQAHDKCVSWLAASTGGEAK